MQRSSFGAWSAIVLLLPVMAVAQKGAAPATDTSKLPPGLYAVFHTSMGTITAELYDTLVPNTVRNFVGLARGTKPWLDPKTKMMVARPLYQNITFHRVIPDFMIQTGDPTATGRHNCGFVIPDEIVPSLRFDRPGRLAMANGGPNTSACQIFLTETPYPAGDGKYIIFGQVVDGQNLIGKIARVIRDDQDKPRFPVKLLSVDVVRVVAAPDLTKPAATGWGVFVNPAGDVLTTAALVEGCTQIRGANGLKLEPAISDRRNQLGLLRSRINPPGTAVLRDGDAVAVGESVSLGGSTPLVSATVSAAADSHNDNRFLRLSASGAPGKAGTPVLDRSGNIAGILLGSTDDAPASDTVIRASVAEGFLDANGIAYRKAVSEAAGDAAALAQDVGKYTVEIQCFR